MSRLPNAGDLVEFFFVGPGACLLVAVAIGVLVGWYRGRDRRRAKLTRALADGPRPQDAIEMLTRDLERLRRGKASPANSLAIAQALRTQASLLLEAGRLEEATGLAREAVEVSEGGAPALVRAAAELTLGQCLGRTDDQAGAAEHLRRAVALSRGAADPDGPRMLALALANASMVVRRLGDAEEAIELATESLQIFAGFQSHPQPYLEMSLAWASAALAMARADTGVDGVGLARGALGTAERLQPVAGGEGVALTRYALAYCLAANGDAEAARQAQTAVELFEELEAKLPGLFSRRVAEARELLARLPGAARG